MPTIDQTLAKLDNSRFRSSFKLTKKEREYIEEKGMETIRLHAVDFVNEKLGPAYPENDGKQTPMHGHPVFKAMHACACCCRECLFKWYKVPKGKELSESAKEKIVNLLMAWIEREYKYIPVINEKIVNSESYSDNREKHSKSEKWVNYARRICDNNEIKRRLYEKYSGTCQNCGKKLKSNWVIQHKTYDRECITSNTIEVPNPTKNRPNRTSKIPDCANCIEIEICLNNLAPVCMGCNRNIAKAVYNNKLEKE